MKAKERSQPHEGKLPWSWNSSTFRLTTRVSFWCKTPADSFSIPADLKTNTLYVIPSYFMYMHTQLNFVQPTSVLPQGHTTRADERRLRPDRKKVGRHEDHTQQESYGRPLGIACSSLSDSLCFFVGSTWNAKESRRTWTYVPCLVVVAILTLL